MVLGHNSYFKNAVFALTLFFSSSLNAAIVQNSVQIGGASTRRLITDNNWVVYGSYLGPTGNIGESSTFNSCSVPTTSGIFVGCNPQRITSNSILTVTFSDDTQFQGQRIVLAYLKETDGLTTSPENINTNTVPQTQGSAYVARIQWSTLCDRAGGQIATYSDAAAIGGANVGEACMDRNNPLVPLNKVVQLAVGLQNDNSGLAVAEIMISLRFFTTEPTRGLFAPTSISPVIVGSDGYSSTTSCAEFNGTTTGASNTNLPTTYHGYCDYKLIPGDEKVRIESNPSIINNLFFYQPNNDYIISVPFIGFNLYLSNDSFANTFPWNSADFIENRFNSPAISSSGFEKSNLESPVIQNERPVFSRLASVDESGNVTHLFADGVNPACDTIPGSSMDPNYYPYFIGQPPAGLTNRCPYATIPSLVTGLLSEDVNCFVATALKGSPYDYQVLALREFRNRFLKSFSLGRSFIDFYYAQGPKAAQWLNQNPNFKPLFRILLWPPYLVAKTFNQLGLFLVLGLLGFILFLPFGIWRIQRSHKLYN